MGVNVREKPAGSGVWWVFINHQGQRKSKRVGAEKAAREVAAKIQARLVLGEFSTTTDEAPKVPTFKEYAEIWLEGTIKPFRRDTTYDRYRDVLARFAYARIGATPLNEIKRKDVRQILMDVHKRGLSRSTIALVKDVISGPFALAIDDEIVTANPTAGILKRMHLTRRKQAPDDVFNQDEIDLFLKACAEREREHYPLFLLLCHTGVRLGEAIGLQWGDVDWNGRFLAIRRSVRRTKVGETKTGRERRVDMTAGLFEVLADLHKRRKVEGLKAGTGLFPYVFNRNGELWSQNSVRNIFKRILVKAGLREIRVHDLRHSYASRLLSAGISPVYVKEQLGHTSISMTVDIYGHWIRGTDTGAVTILDTLQSAPTCTLYAPCEKAKAATP